MLKSGANAMPLVVLWRRGPRAGAHPKVVRALAGPTQKMHASVREVLERAGLSGTWVAPNTEHDFE
jgi:hypothetical protein